MKSHDLQGIELNLPIETTFDYISTPGTLPEWTSAFAVVSDETAIMRTPQGEVKVKLDVIARPDVGCIDWVMRFPNDSVATAFSRLVEIDELRCVYSFVLTPPPVPLEQLEGALTEQSAILRDELGKLKQILEHG